MGIWTHAVTYQGLPCKGASWSLSPGLEPDHGYVDIDMAHVKAIKLEARGVQWRPPHTGGVVPSPIPVTVWSKIKQTSINTAPPVSAPGGGGGGLAALGDLVFTSALDGKTQDAVTYHDLYVSSDGIEELPPIGAGRRQHNEGTVRVRLTDIRAFYDDHSGVFLGGINVRLDSGTGKDVKAVYDRNTINVNFPWTLAEAFRYLFTLLPGSPVLDVGNSDFEDFPNVPTDIVGQGEPVKQILAQLLSRYGLVARFQPDGSYIVTYPLSSVVPYGKIATAPQTFAEIHDVAEERKTVAPTTAPRAVLVVGRRVIRRFTSFYVPVFKNPKDDKIYPLDSVETIFGYPLDKVKKGVFSGSKSFRDVPPVGRRDGFRYGDALKKCAYRWYAPAALFRDPTKPIGISEEELARVPWLPALPAPFRETELSQIDASGTVSGSNKQSANQPWVLHQPVFSAARFGQGFLQDFKELEDNFEERTRFSRIFLGKLKSRYQDLLNILSLKGQSITEPNASVFSNFDQARAAGEGVPFLLAAKSYDIALTLANTITLGFLKSDEADKQTAELAHIASEDAKKIKTQADKVNEAIKIQEDILTAEKKHWDARKHVFKNMKGIPVWRNLPHGPVSGGYSFDPQTGILKFNDPVCQVEESFLFVPEGATIMADGTVFGTWGYEDKAWTPAAWTTALYVAQDSPGPAESAEQPQVVLAGIGHSSQVCPRVEKEPKMRLYVDEFGVPFNATDVATAGLSRAEGALSVVKAAEGYSYTLNYFQAAVLASGVSLVQHTWDATAGEAKTFFAVNYPGAKGLGGRRGGVRESDDSDAVSGESDARTAGGE